MLQSRTLGHSIRNGFVSANGLTDEERKALENFLSVVKEFMTIRPNMPMHQLVVMLNVDLDEGKSLKHYTDKTGYPPSTVSRTFLDNGPKMRTGEEGLGLLEGRTSAHSLWEYETVLTTRGRALFRKVAHRLMRH